LQNVVQLKVTAMKNVFARIAVIFSLFVMFSPPCHSQFVQFDYESAGVSMSIPSNWVTSEHILLLLMPKAEDLTLEVEVLNGLDLSEAVELSAIELKSVFPLDTSFVVNDIVINKMPVKKIDKISGDEQLIFYFLKTPTGKIVKLHCQAPKEKIVKYKGDLTKIIQSIKPKQ
jgi:hypothetical protein